MPKISVQESVEAIKFVPQKRISEWLCEQMWVIEVPKISSQEIVEAVENVLQERIPERMCEQIRLIDVPKVSSQESVDAVKKMSFGVSLECPRSRGGKESRQSK